MTAHALTGTWRYTHSYPSKDDSNEETMTHEMSGYQVGNELILQSVEDAGKSYILVRLSLDRNIATGTWHETSLPSGEFKGAMYSGAGQMVASDDQRSMEGIWAGAGFDHKLNKTRIYTGTWKLERVD